MMKPLSEYTDEELDAMIANGGHLPTAPTAPVEVPGAGKVKSPMPALGNAAKEVLGMTDDPDKTHGMNGLQLGLAGAGGWLNDLGETLGERGRLFFRPQGPEGDKILSDINAQRADRQGALRALYSNPEARFGKFGAQALTGAVAPARAGAQAALFGGLEGMASPPGKVSDSLGELGGSLVNAGQAAGITGGLGAMMAPAGKALGAARKDWTDPNAMATDAAAKRVGVDLSVGDLDPNSPLGKMDLSLPGRAKRVEEQAGQLRTALDAKRDVPSKSGNSTEERVLPGENLRQGIKDASDELYSVARDKYQAVDDFANANKLRPVIPRETYKALQGISQLTDAKGNNPVFDLIRTYAPKETGWMEGIAAAPIQHISYGAPLVGMSDMRMAINKALRKLDRPMSADPTNATVMEQYKKLIALKNSIDNDIDNWGTINARNKPAVEKLNAANQFYREVMVPDVINNKVVGKSGKGPIGTNPRGYSTAHQFYTDVVNNPELLGRVKGSMSPSAQDLTTAFTSANDARGALLSGRVNPDQASLLRAGATALGHPGAAAATALSHIPGISDLVTTQLVKKLHFGKNQFENSPLGRIAYGLAADPRMETEDYLNHKLRPAGGQ